MHYEIHALKYMRNLVYGKCALISPQKMVYEWTQNCQCMATNDFVGHLHGEIHWEPRNKVVCSCGTHIGTRNQFRQLFKWESDKPSRTKLACWCTMEWIKITQALQKYFFGAIMILVMSQISRIYSSVRKVSVTFF